MSRKETLDRYQTVRGMCRAGDIVAFSGTEPVSRLIQFFSASDITHVGVVRQPAVEGRDVMLSESTIDGKRSGVQTNMLNLVLSEYQNGGSASLLRLRADIRALIDWEKFYKALGEEDGFVEYDIEGLFLFLAPSIPLFGQFIADARRQEDPKKMFCDGFAVALFESCGILRGINYRTITPQGLIEMAIYEPEPIPLLGKLKLKRFNTV